MATPTIQQGRLITKRSAIPGTVPTVPAVDDIETFTPTDIFKGELFYNIPDNILYIRDDTGIIIISSGGAPIPYIYYTEVTTPGSEEAKIEVTDGGTNLSDIKVFPTSVFIESTDGTNNNNIIFGNDGTGGWLATDGSNNSSISLQPNNTEYYSVNGSVVSKVKLTAAGDAELTATNGTNINSFYAQSSGGVISKAYDGTGNNSDVDIQYGSITSTSTNGTDTTVVTIEPNRIRNSINLGDPTQYEKEVNITTGIISEQMIISGVGAYTNGISPSQYYFQLNDGAGKIKRIDLDNLSNYINIRSIDNTDLSEVIMSPTDITTSVTDGINTTLITQTPTSISITGIGSYASDAAAGTAGLVAGDMYKTDGTGSGIFATPGILMIKQ